MANLIRFFILLSITLSGAAALAHHSFQATFTSDAKIDVEGAAATLMHRAGWDRDTVKPGDLIRVHSDQNLVTKTTVVDERGRRVNGRGDDPNRHDILTGSQMDGTALNNDSDSTCSNWSNNGAGSALVGHFDREGGGQNPTSWNSAHGSRGCSQSDLQGSGGDGLFYCFAAD